MDSTNLNPLIHACTYKKVQVVEKLLSLENINVNCVCGNETPLIVATSRRLVSIVQLLLNHPETTDPNYVSKSGVLPLLSCIRSRYSITLIGGEDQSLATVSELLLNHPRIEASVHLAMETACHKGFTDVVRLLIKYPITNVNGVDKDGISYLHSACFFGHTEIVELLLQHDAIDVFIKTNNGNTPLNFAVKKGRNEIVDMLVRHPQFDPCTMFIPSR
jgi:ankyrin repeat protein